MSTKLRALDIVGIDPTNDAFDGRTRSTEVRTAIRQEYAANRAGGAASQLVSADFIPLTSRQKSIWLEIKTIGAKTGYQLGGYFICEAALDRGAFEAALGEVVARHDALRLRIDDREPQQRLEFNVNPHFDFVDFSGEPDPVAAFLKFGTEQFSEPLLLDGSPLFRTVLCKAGPERYCVVFRLHHLIADGISAQLIIQDLARSYNARLGLASTNAAMAPSYLAFVEDDLKYRKSRLAASDIEYWCQRFSEVPPAIFPQRPAEWRDGDDDSRAVLCAIPRNTFDALLARCKEHNVRPLNALIAIVTAVLIEPSERAELVIGIAVPGRMKAQAELVGQLAGIVPLRCVTTSQQSIIDLSRSCGDQLARDYKRQRVPVDELTRALRLGKLGRRSVFDVFLSFTPAERSSYEFTFGGGSLSGAPFRSEEANPLALYITDHSHKQDPLVEFAFNPGHLARSEVEEIRTAFVEVLEQFVAKPEQAIPMRGLASAIRCAKAALQPSAALEPQRTGHPVAIRISATFTAEPVQRPFQFFLRTLGCEPKLAFSGYNQVFQELLDPNSLTRRSTSGVNIILLRLEDWLRNRRSAEGGDLRTDADIISSTVRELVDALAIAVGTTKASLMVMLCPPSPSFELGSFNGAIQGAGEKILTEGCAAIAGLRLIHYAEARALYPVTEEHDARSLEFGHVPYSDDGFTAIASLLARRTHHALRRPFKVVSVDCDNTLWRGVVGEDGSRGIAIEPSHQRLQKRLVEAAAAGMLICLVSKNDHADVADVLNTRADMLLKPEHIVTSRVNWLPKSQNLVDIASELNLGLDSFIFLDDNPVEIAEVSAACPAVASIQVPADGGSRSYFIDHLWPLDPGMSTAEDTKRTQLYRENGKCILDVPRALLAS